MDNVSELMEKHPVLAALIKLEVSNSLLRLQLGEDPTSCLQSRLDAALSDNSSLVLKVAGKDPSRMERRAEPAEAKEQEQEGTGNISMVGKVKSILKGRRSRTSSNNDDADVSGAALSTAAGSSSSSSNSSNHNNAAMLSSISQAQSQSPIPVVGASVPRAQKRVVSAVRRPSYDAMSQNITGSLAANGQFATPVRAVEEGGGVDGEGDVQSGPGSSPVKAMGALEGEAGAAEVATEAFPPPDANYLEMCEVGVDRSILSGAKPAVTSLQRAQVVNKFPAPPPVDACTGAGAVVAGAVQVLDSSVVPNITEFCFPRGVPLDIVSATAADFIAGPQFDTYHVMQFSDADGNHTFGCCIIITEKIRPSSEVVELQLLELQRQKKASNVICTRMKEYIRYKEHMRWAVKPAGVDNNVGNKAQRRRATMSSITSTATASDNGDTGSVSSDVNSPVPSGKPPQPGESGYKRSVFSKFFSRKEATTPAEHGHGGKPELSTPGPMGAMYPFGETPDGEYVSPVGRPAADKGSVPTSAFKTPAAQGKPGTANGGRASPSTIINTAANTPAVPAGPPPTVSKAAPTPSAVQTPAKKRFSWFGGSSVPSTPMPEPAAGPLPSLLEEMHGDTGTGPMSRPAVPPVQEDMSPASEPASSRCTSVSEVESESGDDGFVAEDGSSHEDEGDRAKLRKALGAMYDLNMKSDDDEDDDEESRSRKASLAAAADQPLPLGATAVAAVAKAALPGAPEGHFSPVVVGVLPAKPSAAPDAGKRLSITKAGAEALVESAETAETTAAAAQKAISVDTAVPVKKRSGRGKMIVTKKAFCILSRNANHAFLFKVLQKIIDTEARSAAGRSRVPSLASIGGGVVVDEAEYSAAVNSVLADVKVCDPPVTSKLSLTDAIGLMTVSNRNRFLAAAMCCDLSGVIECRKANAPSTLGIEDQNLNATMAKDRLSCASYGGRAGKSFDEVEDKAKSFAIECRSYFTEPLVISETFSSFKEWSCAILFATISHTLIIKIMNLLLLEKSILIYGTDVGIVSAIASALIEIVSPFAWEGVFVPVMPYIAKEVLQAPVPFIIGSTSLPKMEDLSPNAAIIFLDAKLGCRDIPIEECAWFMSIPEVDANMPVGESLSKLLKYANQRLSKYLPLYKERLQKWSANTSFSMPRSNSVAGASSVKLDDVAVRTPPSSVKHGADVNAPGSPAPGAVGPLSPAAVPTAVCRRSPADLQKTFLYGLTAESKSIIHKVLDAIARHNVAFCGDAAHTGGWIRYCKYNKHSGMEEFYPQWFMQPRRATTEFQEALVQTQLFVSYLDKLRVVYEKNTWQRDVISDWLYSRILIRKARDELASRVVAREAKKAADAAKALEEERLRKVKEEEARKKAAEKAAREEKEKSTYWAQVAAAQEKTAKAKAGQDAKAGGKKKDAPVVKPTGKDAVPAPVEPQSAPAPQKSAAAPEKSTAAAQKPAAAAPQKPAAAPVKAAGK